MRVTNRQLSDNLSQSSLRGAVTEVKGHALAVAAPLFYWPRRKNMQGKKKNTFTRYLGVRLPNRLKLNIELQALETGRSISSLVTETLMREYGDGQKKANKDA
jgi:hypothetical protein